MYILDFEKPIAELEQKIQDIKAHAEAEDIDMAEELSRLEEKARKLKEEVYSNLSRWQKVQLARHPQRPHTLDYIERIATDFIALHGDRFYSDDHAMVGGIAKVEGKKILIIGHQKGKDTKDNLYRNFGMPHPEGYRKALRLMKLAAKFHRPVLSLIDTQGAYPGVNAEERGQAEAIARNIFEMSHLPVPIVIAIVGEGASGGALGIGVGDKILMMEHTWYSVIAPESCSTILWRDREKKEEAAEALKLTPGDLLKLGIIDEIIPEPLGGAHRDYDEAASRLKSAVLATFSQLEQIPPDELIKQRVDKFTAIGAWEE